MKYTDMVKKANRFSNLTEEQAIDYMLTNAREMDQDARDAMEERLNTINPREFHYLYPFADAFKKADMYNEVERYNKDFKGLGVVGQNGIQKLRFPAGPFYEGVQFIHP